METATITNAELKEEQIKANKNGNGRRQKKNKREKKKTVKREKSRCDIR